MLVATETVNVYANPSGKAKVIGVAKKGELIPGCCHQKNDFLEVAFRGKCGWIAKQWLTPAEAGAVTQVAFKGAGTYLSTGDQVVIRQDPQISAPPYGTGSNVKAILFRGDKVLADGTVENVYAHVTAPVDGWISTNYLTPEGTPLPPQTPQGDQSQTTPPPPPPDTKPTGPSFLEGKLFGTGKGIVLVLVALALGIYYFAGGHKHIGHKHPMGHHLLKGHT